LSSTAPSPRSAVSPRFQPAAPLTDADVAELVEQLARRITRYLERQGRLPRAHAPVDADQPDEHEASLFDQLCAASISGSAALAPESSRPIARLGQRRPPRPPPLLGSPAPTKAGRGPGRPAKVAASTVPTKRRGKRGKRTTEDVAKMGEVVVAYVAKNPGQSLEQIKKVLDVEKKDLQLPIIRMIDAKKLRTTGERRGTRYFVR
jgi:hypothetical protein